MTFRSGCAWPCVHDMLNWGLGYPRLIPIELSHAQAAAPFQAFSNHHPSFSLALALAPATKNKVVNIIFLDHFWKWELEAYLEGGVGALRLRVAGQVRFLGLLGWRLLQRWMAG